MRELIQNKPFLIGSKYFFSNYTDFKPHDTDVLEIVDYDDPLKDMQQIRIPGKDIFRVRKRPINDIISFDITNNIPMSVGKYLVPEIANALGLSIDNITILQTLIDNLDDKHLYEKVIYDSYISNNSFTLTDTQRDKAYEIYKLYRK